MMEKTAKINILWLDDDFMKESSGVISQLEEFKNSSDNALFNIVPVGTSSDFVEKYKKNPFWDAVILDVYGYEKADGVKDPYTVFEAIRGVTRKNTLITIYTSEAFVENDQNSIIRRLLLDQYVPKIFHKLKETIFDICSYIKETLENVLRRDFPDYDVIKSKISDEKLSGLFDNVMNLYKENAHQVRSFTQEDLQIIRPFIEGVFKKDAERVIGVKKSLGESLKELEDNECKDKFVRAAIEAMIAFANPPEHYSDCDYTSYGRYAFHALFFELFICLKWYYCVLCPSIPPVDTGDNIVKVDEAGNAYVGNVLLPISSAFMEGWKLHEDFEFKSDPVRNTRKADNLNCLYYFAKYKRLPKK